MKINEVFLKPILTEKGMKLINNKTYMFEVKKEINKFQIKSILEKLYAVKIGAVKIINRKGKIKKMGRKMAAKRTPDKKIAYVQLKEGKINIFPQA